VSPVSGFVNAEGDPGPELGARAERSAGPQPVKLGLETAINALAGSWRDEAT